MQPDGPLTLGFDTSAAFCAAALFSGDRVVVSRHEEMAKGQAERLMVLLEDVLEEAGAEWSDLTSLGVGIGPGNFTGIRISVAAARGLALGLGVPAVGISSLEAQAFGLTGPTLSLIDARRDRVYHQVFESDQEYGPGLSALDEINTAAYPGIANVVGYQSEDIASRLGALAVPTPPRPAEAIATLAARRASATSGRPAPLYIRPADATPSTQPVPALLP